MFPALTNQPILLTTLGAYACKGDDVPASTNEHRNSFRQLGRDNRNTRLSETDAEHLREHSW
jgi:hypothetical protein